MNNIGGIFLKANHRSKQMSPSTVKQIVSLAIFQAQRLGKLLTEVLNL